MTTLDDILFPVEKVEIKDFACNSDYAFDIYARPTINGEETKVRVNSCSDMYELIPNSEIFPNIRQVLLDNGIVFEESYEMRDYARFNVNYTIKKSFAGNKTVINDKGELEIVPEYKSLGHKMKGSNSDVIYPRINIQHSYNGLVKYKIIFGYYRMVCSNGLVIPVEELKQYNLEITGKHTQAIRASFHKLDDTIKYFLANKEQITGAITAKYDMLSGNAVLNVEDRITEVLAQLNYAPKVVKDKNGIESTSFKILDEVMKTVYSEAHQYNGEINDWLIYNGINSYIFDPKFKAAANVRAEKDSKVFEYMIFNQ